MVGMSAFVFTGPHTDIIPNRSRFMAQVHYVHVNEAEKILEIGKAMKFPEVALSVVLRRPDGKEKDTAVVYYLDMLVGLWMEFNELTDVKWETFTDTGPGCPFVYTTPLSTVAPCQHEWYNSTAGQVCRKCGYTIFPSTINTTGE